MGENFSDHVQNLEKVLGRLKEACLTLKTEKCDFFKSSINYLGHVISSEGIKPQESKLSAIKAIPPPVTVHDIQSFLGLTNYYRKFVSKYSQIISPLLKLKGTKGEKPGALKKKDKTPLVWTDAAHQAFKTLKDKMCREVTVQFPDFSKNFV